MFKKECTGTCFSPRSDLNIKAPRAQFGHKMEKRKSEGYQQI